MLSLTPDLVLNDAITPHVAGLVPAATVGGLPLNIEEASAAIGLQRQQFVEHGDGSFQADLDIPAGIWRYWLDGRAVWIADREAVLPPLPERCALERIDLFEAVTRLHEAGHWASELVLLGLNGWGPPMRFRDALAVLTDPSANLLGIAGYWSDNDGSARVEIYEAGQVWADDRLRAERFILVATGHES